MERFLEMLREVKHRKARDAPFTEPEREQSHRCYLEEPEPRPPAQFASSFPAPCSAR